MIPTKKVIVNAKIIAYENEILKVVFDDNKIGFCPRNQISDYEIYDIQKYFSRFPLYKFKVIKENEDGTFELSYKYAHPNLVKNKKNIIPTAKHYSTLKKYVFHLLQEENKNE